MKQMSIFDVPIHYWHEHEQHSPAMRKFHKRRREGYMRIDERVKSHTKIKDE